MIKYLQYLKEYLEWMMDHSAARDVSLVMLRVEVAVDLPSRFGSP